MRVYKQRSVTKVFFCVLWETFFFCCGCCCLLAVFVSSLIPDFIIVIIPIFSDLYQLHHHCDFPLRNSSTLSSSSACLLNPFLCLQVLLSSPGFWLIIIGGGLFSSRRSTCGFRKSRVEVSLCIYLSSSIVTMSSTEVYPFSDSSLPTFLQPTFFWPLFSPSS